MSTQAALNARSKLAPTLTSATAALQQRLGRNLRARREAQGLSQDALAHQLGISRSYLGSIEGGKRNVTLKIVQRLAEEVGVEAVELLAD